MIYGGEAVFSQHKVDFMQFEYNQRWHEVPNHNASTHSLKAIVAHLENHGYDTFLIGGRNLYQLSRGLWDEKFEFWAWSNCIALSRKMDPAIRFKLVDNFNLDFPTLKPIEL